jgi:PKD repeat protein
MKSVLFTLLLLAVIVSACSKSSKNTTPVKEEVVVPVLTAKFAVTYTINNDGVKEGDNVPLENQSVNAVSYLWDFGNGFTSTEKNPVNQFGCGTLPVKLTVTGSTGATATFTKDLLVYCKGKNNGGRSGNDGHVHTGITGE